MLWKRNIPAGVLEKDTTCLQLEFKAQLSFAVYPLKRGLNSKVESDETDRSKLCYVYLLASLPLLCFMSLCPQRSCFPISM